jgi:hypothetical protein
VEALKKATSSTLNLGAESVAETLENFHALTRPSAQQEFMEFCHREGFKTDTDWTLPVSDQNSNWGVVERSMQIIVLLLLLLLYYLFTYLLQLSFHSVAVVLTLVT